jgi:hypothetical protein
VTLDGPFTSAIETGDHAGQAPRGLQLAKGTIP